jgi:GntR family transcriptional regulator
MKDYQMPKYLSIANEIIAQIEKRILLPGEKIPSENDIIRNHQVSNTTARKVLLELESKGWGVKIQGKGTFVRDFVIERNATKILSFTKNMTNQGLIPSTKLLDAEVINKDVPISLRGKFYIIKKPVFRIHRLRMANDVPMMHEIRYISMQYCPDIEKQNMEKSLYTIYRDVYNLNISLIDQELTSILLTEETCKLFEIKDFIPGLQVDGVTFCGEGLLLEGEKSVYRGDKYKFSVQAMPERNIG